MGSWEDREGTYEQLKGVFDYILPGHTWLNSWDEARFNKNDIEIHITIIMDELKISGRDFANDYDNDEKFPSHHYFDETFKLSDPNFIEKAKDFCAARIKKGENVKNNGS